MARWPSGLRRQTKVHDSNAAHLIRKGVGSNPTLVTFAPLPPLAREYSMGFVLHRISGKS
jgi:hypothetical protein